MAIYGFTCIDDHGHAYDGACDESGQVMIFGDKPSVVKEHFHEVYCFTGQCSIRTQDNIDKKHLPVAWHDMGWPEHLSGK